MLEQRSQTAIFEQISIAGRGTFSFVTNPVEVKFVDGIGDVTRPDLTQSSNLSAHATSSTPYTDGESGVSTRGTIYNSNIIPVFPDDYLRQI